MSATPEQLKRLKAAFPGVQTFVEGGVEYHLVPALVLPEGCTPAVADALICTTMRDGYPCRVFFSAEIRSRTPQNWNHKNILIIDHVWYAFSWKIQGGPLSPLEVLFGFLKGLQ